MYKMNVLWSSCTQTRYGSVRPGDVTESGSMHHTRDYNAGQKQEVGINHKILHRYSKISLNQVVSRELPSVELTEKSQEFGRTGALFELLHCALLLRPLSSGRRLRPHRAARAPAALCTVHSVCVCAIVASRRLRNVRLAYL